MHGEARKKYTTSFLNYQKNSNRQKPSKQHKKLVNTGPCSTSTFFRGKELFYWVMVWSDNAEDITIYSSRIGLVKLSAASFTVCRELNSFDIISCFLDKTCNTCIELGIVPLPLTRTGCDGFCVGQELSSKQPILILHLSTSIHFFKWQI